MDTDNGKVNTILSEEVLVITEAQPSYPMPTFPTQISKLDPLLLLLDRKISHGNTRLLSQVGEATIKT